MEQLNPSGYLDTVPLTEAHRTYLRECAIGDEFIDARPYLSLTEDLREELCKEWRFHPAQLDREGLVICRYDVATGGPAHPQVRYDVPRPDANGREQKYCAAKNSGGVIDAHPLIRERVLDPSEDLWIAESIKGEDAIISHGCAAIGFFGVGGWSKERITAASWDAIPLRGRTVILAFDSDIRDTSKRGPLLQAGRICHYLVWARGAQVAIAQIPYAEDGTKQGIDDALRKVG